ncbi:MAG: zinc dependent phospholipase C family protein [Angelakisella sp.]
MPDFATHQLFGESLELPAAAAAHPALFRWGLQGPDILFYRKVITGGSPYHKLGSRMHEEQTARLFSAMLAYCRQSEGEQQAQAQSYLYGFAGHYALDSTVHPYVYFHQNKCVEENPKLHPGGVHCRIESDMDTDIYAYLHGGGVTDLDPSEGYELTKGEEQTLGALYTYMLYEVYHILITPKEVAASVRDTTTVQKLLYGGSETVMSAATIMDKLMKQQGIFTGHLKGKQPRWDSLNLDGARWSNPWTGEESRESVPQLMDRAAERLTELLAVLTRNAAGAVLPLPIGLNFSGKATGSI